MLRAALYLSLIKFCQRFSCWNSFIRVKWRLSVLSGDRVFSWRQSQLRLKIKMNFSLCAAVSSPINKKSRAEISRFELQLFAFLCLESAKNLHYQQQFQMAGASPLLYVTVQRLASDCMSFSSYDPLLWPTMLPLIVCPAAGRKG